MRVHMGRLLAINAFSEQYCSNFALNNLIKDEQAGSLSESSAR